MPSRCLVLAKISAWSRAYCRLLTCLVVWSNILLLMELLAPIDHWNLGFVLTLWVDLIPSTMYVCISAPIEARWIQQAGFEPLHEWYSITSWPWETQQWPESWLSLLNITDELWPSGHFTAEALVGHASEVELDKNARLLLPAKLREHANLEKHLLLAGMGNTFQIWDETQWNDRIREDMQSHADHSLSPEDMPDLKF